MEDKADHRQIANPKYSFSLWEPIASNLRRTIVHNARLPLAIWASNNRPQHFKQDQITRLPLFEHTPVHTAVPALWMWNPQRSML